MQPSCLSQWVSCVSCSLLAAQGSWLHPCHHPGSSHCITMHWGRERGAGSSSGMCLMAAWHAPLTGSCVMAAAKRPLQSEMPWIRQGFARPCSGEQAGQDDVFSPRLGAGVLQGWEQDSQALGMGEPPLWLVATGTAHLPINSAGSHGFSSLIFS